MSLGRPRVNYDVNFNSPCYQCADRYMGCHDKCNKYQSAKHAYEEKKKVVADGRNKYVKYYGYYH